MKQGKSRRAIARQLGIHRKTIGRIEQQLNAGNRPPMIYHREKKLDDHLDMIKKAFEEEGLSVQLIWEKLKNGSGLKVSYSTVCRHVKKLKKEECFVPMETAPGEEAQVDFGYLGRFRLEDGQWVKVWGFAMILSYSRYAYFEAVLDQSVATFIKCHWHAFEYYGGVPATIKLDNLKAGVIQPDFYEPLLQEQYAEFLAHYGCAAKPCRIRKPQHKGKVESGIKYLKGNFVRGLADRLWSNLGPALRLWMDQVCNMRRHGTIHQIPAQLFEERERAELLPLPAQRYEFYEWEERKVNRFGHVTFRQNYYSVPYQLMGLTLRLKSNDSMLRIYQGLEQVAVHSLLKGKGLYQTREEHKPPYKQQQSQEYYRDRLGEIGPAAVAMMERLLVHDTRHWKEKVRGILHLAKHHPAAELEKACRLAVDNQLYSYQAVRNICEHLLKLPPPLTAQILPGLGGFNHDLSIYDQLP